MGLEKGEGEEERENVGVWRGGVLEMGENIEQGKRRRGEGRSKGEERGTCLD